MNILSIIKAHSVTLQPNCEPFAITLTYQGQPVDYWILRGEIADSFGTLTNQEFIHLRGLHDEGNLPADWTSVVAIVDGLREAATDGDGGQVGNSTD